MIQNHPLDLHPDNFRSLLMFVFALANYALMYAANILLARSLTVQGLVERPHQPGCAVYSIRRVLHEGLIPRPLQEKAMRKSYPQPAHLARAKPYVRIPHSKYLRKSCSM